MSTYRAHQGPRPTTNHHPLMAALIGVSLGAGLLIVGASVASAVDAQPFCSEYDTPDTVAPVDVAPNDVTPPTTAPVVVPIAVVPVATPPAPTTTQAPVPTPAVVAPADVAAPPTTLTPAEAPVTTEAPRTEVLGESVENNQSTAPTLPVTGVPTAQLLLAAMMLLIAGESMRRMAARRVSDALAGDAMLADQTTTAMAD